MKFKTQKLQYMDQGYIRPDNNRVENAMRTFFFGRNNTRRKDASQRHSL